MPQVNYPPAPHPVTEVNSRLVTRPWLAFFQQLLEGTFGTVHITGDGTVVAGSNSDTLNLTPGSGITITSDPSTNTITISTAGSVVEQKTEVKTSHQSVTNSTSLQNDTQLTFSIGANETWGVDFALYVSGPPAGGFKWAIAAPIGATGTHGGHRLPFGSTTPIDNLDASTALVLGDSGALSAGTAA